MGEPSRVRVTGPLEPFAAGFIAVLEEAGYRPAAAAVQIRVLAHFSRWMLENDVSPGELREPELERFRSCASIWVGSRACAVPERRWCSTISVGSGSFLRLSGER